MSSQSRWITVAVAASVAVMAMGQASAQSYGNPGYDYQGNGYSNNGYPSNGYPSNGYSYNNGYGHARIVRCESIGSHRNFCRVDTQGRVQITRQLSNRTCIQGRNWSYNDRGIWVDGGCRAEFAVGSRHDHRYGDSNGYNNTDYNRYNYHPLDTGNDYRYSDPGHTHYVDNSGRVIHCTATVDGRTYCGDAHTHYTMGGTRDPDCIEGQNWGTDGRGTWVSGNCSADFIGDDQYNDNTNSGYYQH